MTHTLGHNINMTTHLHHKVGQLVFVGVVLARSIPPARSCERVPHVVFLRVTAAAAAEKTVDVATNHEE